MAQSTSGKTFELPLQHAVEQIVTDSLLAQLQAVLPRGAHIRRLERAEQVHGDLAISDGSRTVYIELKTEDYARSLFIEPVQFWVQKPGHGTYRRSWAYTTTAHWMLYLSARTGALLLCPRRQWLQTGLQLFEAHLLQSLERDKASAYRPYVALNTQLARGDERRRFSGGAAGAGIDTWTWFEGFAQAGHDTSRLVLADGAELLAAARAKVAAWSDPWLQSYMSGCLDARMLARPGVFAGVAHAVRQWAAAEHAPESAVAARIRGALESVGGQANASLEALGQALLQPLADDARDALDDSMWFAAAACLQCGWTLAQRDGSRAIVDEAIGTVFRLNKAGLAPACDVPAGMRELGMRFDSHNFSARGPRQGWQDLKKWFALPDERALPARRDYVRMFRHAA